LQIVLPAAAFKILV